MDVADAGMGTKGGYGRAAVRSSRLTVIGLALVLSLTGCGVRTGISSMMGWDNSDYASPEARTLQQASIAVLPFENLTTHQNAGTIMADMMTTELYRLGALRVMEPSRTRSLLTSTFGDADARGETAYAQEIGRKLGVQTVMMGSVSEYGYQYGLREEPVVGINLRVVRVADGAVVWASSDSDIGSSFWSRDSVNEVAQRVAARLAERLGKAITTPAKEGAAPARLTVPAPLPAPVAPAAETAPAKPKPQARKPPKPPTQTPPTQTPPTPAG